MDSALQNVNNVVFSSSLEESQTAYESWSASYDQDLEVLGCYPSKEAVKMFVKHAMNSNVVLDVGGGTALVVEFLRKEGFQNTFDVLDASLQMLVLGEKKQINIRNIIRHYVQDDGILPLKDESYDALTCAGAFIPNHIPPTALEGLLKAVKRGGFLILTVRSNSTGSYKAEYDQVVQGLLEAGKMQIIDQHDYMHFEKLEKENVRSVVYVYKRL